MYYYILNPTSGSGSINNLQDKLRSTLNAYGIGGEFAKTTGPGDATKLAKSALEKGYNTIIAVGGDDTVNEVINGLAGSPAAIFALGARWTGACSIEGCALGTEASGI